MGALKSEVQKWMAQAHELERLGMEAVQEVYVELEKERTEKADLVARLDDERGRYAVLSTST